MKKQPYDAPHLTVVSFRVERGFTDSLYSTPIDREFSIFRVFAENQPEDNAVSSFDEQAWSW